MTVSEMATYVARILGDGSNTKWNNTNHIIPALNSAQEEFVIMVLGYASQYNNAYGLLTELQATTTQSINTTGYDLSDLDSTAAFMRNGIIAVKVMVDGKERWARLMETKSLGQQQNSYMRGNDERPIYYEFNETLYIEVTSGSYPVSTTVYYVRKPKELVASSATGYKTVTCELDGVLHRMISELAAANCWRMLGDENSLAKYDRMMNRVSQRIQGIVTLNVLPKSTKQQEIE